MKVKYSDLRNKTLEEIGKILDKHQAEHDAHRNENHAKDLIKMFYGLMATTDIEKVCVPRFVTRYKFYKLYKHHIERTQSNDLLKEGRSQRMHFIHTCQGGENEK